MRYIEPPCLRMRYIKLPCLRMRFLKLCCPRMGCIEPFCLRNIVNLFLPFIITCSRGCKKLLPSILIHAGEKLVWALWITLQSFQHSLRMYTWSLFENQASVTIPVRMVATGHLVLCIATFAELATWALKYTIYSNFGAFSPAGPKIQSQIQCYVLHPSI